MQSGLFWGYVDMVEGLVRRMRRSSAAPRSSSPPAASRRSSRPRRKSIEHVDPELTLRGLRLVWERQHVIDV